MMLISKLTCAYLIAIFLMACSLEFTPDEGAAAVRQGPENTFFVGGVDGGDYLRISPVEGEPGYYSGVIFYENGSLAYRGKFKAEPSKDNLPLDAPHHFSGFDGTQVIMADGTVLQPLGPIQPITPTN